MSATKSAFPMFRFIYRLLASRAARLVLLFLLALPVATWCTLRFSMSITVWRANALLRRIKQIKPRESTYEDALKLANDYGSLVSFGKEPCAPKSCSIFISMTNPWPGLVFNADIDFLRMVGIRKSSFDGWLNVRDGRVISTGFFGFIEAKHGTLQGQWLAVRSTIADHFSNTEETFYYGWRLGLEEHPNWYVLKPHLTTKGGGQMIFTMVTPDATASEIERAFDFRLSCISTLAGCSELKDIVPLAWKEYLAQDKRSPLGDEDRKYGPCPSRSLARLARDMDNVLLVEVKRVFPVADDEPWSQDVEYRLVEILKGHPDEHLARFPMTIRECCDESSQQLPGGLPSEMFAPGKRIVLLLQDVELGFIPFRHCEVVAATEENLGIIRQTITQLSQGLPITALRQDEPRH